MYGKEHEKDAIDQLSKDCNISILEAKKVVPKSFKWLVCIPDGITEEKDTIVEVKCPFKCLNESLENVAEIDENFCLEITGDGELSLRKDHDYFYQVQGMLNIMEVDVCYFAVWTPSQFHHEVIHRDTQLWDEIMFPKLLDFYRVHLLDNKWNVPDVDEDAMEAGKIKILEDLR